MSMEAQQTQRYRLPHPNLAIESYVATANQAIQAEREPERLYRQALAIPGSDWQAAAQPALSAQERVCQALQAAVQAAVLQKDVLARRISEVNAEIRALEAQAAQLRANLAESGGREGKFSYAAPQAKELLACLESAYKKNDLIRTLQNNLTQTNENLRYLETCHSDAEDSLRQLGQLQAAQAREPLQPLIREDDPLPHPQLPLDREGEGQAFTAPPQPASGRDRGSVWLMIWSYVKVVFVAFLLALALRAYVFDVTQVEGTSMYPTLNDGDALITAKISYVLGSQPQRGDIVVLKAPDSPGEDYIKRVIGLPDDTIDIENGKVYINGELLQEPYLESAYTPGTVVHTIIPTGFYFVMGDNRSDSRDSRVDEVGLISRDDIRGKSVFRVYPFVDFGSLY